ncbi:hypothetical protein OG225_07110 [Nocardia sp. NBC_01377]|uniref:hypothetical protein n=1 Tax=Nocardia sp. NBC_01377 TaxID=2903595 RepID=UPI003250E708
MTTVAEATEATEAEAMVKSWLTRPPVLLEVTVHTVCVVGIEPVDARAVDVDTVRDGDGVPYVPKNRMSARLRDAALLVTEGPGSVDAALEVFGGAFSAGTERRLLEVGAATWPRQARAGVASALAERERRYRARGRALLATRIGDALTVRVGQTAIGADGAPVDGSLRHLRGIRPGVVLQAELRWRGDPQPRHLRVLARAVLALTQIGDGESDNYGRVSCRIDGDEAATVACAFEEIDR